jgi:hypothetical protein
MYSRSARPAERKLSICSAASSDGGKLARARPELPRHVGHSQRNLRAPRACPKSRPLCPALPAALSATEPKEPGKLVRLELDR